MSSTLHNTPYLWPNSRSRAPEFDTSWNIVRSQTVGINFPCFLSHVEVLRLPLRGERVGRDAPSVVLTSASQFLAPHGLEDFDALERNEYLQDLQANETEKAAD